MAGNLIVEKQHLNPERSLARVIPIRYFLKEKTMNINLTAKHKEKKETISFYNKPIFRAKKYELF